MGIRKSAEEEVVVTGLRDQWLLRCEKALTEGGFKNIKRNGALHQITADYKTLTTVGDIVVSLTPSGEGDTKLMMKSSANVDNLFAAFKSPNKVILEKFKEGL